MSTFKDTWDLFDCYLFDIDGTLIESKDATHYFAFCAALKMIAGRELTLEGVTAHGNTDIGILRDAYALAGVKDDDWRPRLPEIRNAMATFVEQHKGELRATVLPSVHQVLRHLESRGAILGVATGNLEGIGRLKLEQARLMHYFQFAGWSDEHEYRSQVFRAAGEIGRRVAGKEASFCVVGDTPADVRAGHENGIPVIAVATGIYSYQDLLLEKPELCLRSLADLFAKD